MSMNESVAYLKGLAEGLDIDIETKEGKLLNAIIDVLDEMASEISEIEETCDELDEIIDIIDEDLGNLESEVYGDDDDDDDCDCCDGDLYEVTCPMCGNEVYLGEDTIIEGSVECSECGEKLEFDLSGCDCGCENDHDCDCDCDCDK